MMGGVVVPLMLVGLMQTFPPHCPGVSQTLACLAVLPKQSCVSAGCPSGPQVHMGASHVPLPGGVCSCSHNPPRRWHSTHAWLALLGHNPTTKANNNDGAHRWQQQHTSLLCGGATCPPILRPTNTAECLQLNGYMCFKH